LGHAVVADPRKLRGDVRRSDHLERRRREREDLLVAFEQIHDAKPLVEIDHHRHVVAAFRDVHDLAGLLELRVKRFRPDVIEDIELAHRISPRNGDGYSTEWPPGTTSSRRNEGNTARRLRRTRPHAAR